jgi:hypothetical protein
MSGPPLSLRSRHLAEIAPRQAKEAAEEDKEKEEEIKAAERDEKEEEEEEEEIEAAAELMVGDESGEEEEDADDDDAEDEQPRLPLYEIIGSLGSARLLPRSLVETEFLMLFAMADDLVAQARDLILGIGDEWRQCRM